MHIGLLYVRLSIPGAQSLKERRRPLRSIKDRLRKMNVAVAEVGDRTHWQLAELATVCVCNERVDLDRLLGEVAEIMHGTAEVVVLQEYQEER